MNRSSVTNTLLAVIAVLLLLNLVSGTGRAYDKSPVQYRTVSAWNRAKLQEVDKLLSKEGENGWELVAIYQMNLDNVFVLKK
jgi:hypothetical protein